MIQYTKEVLANGLTVLLHEDKNTPMIALNLLYKVGSKDESEDKTGFAHLFEHLMFGGSENIKNYDEVAHLIGASNNAFTNTDITNYYLTFPAENLETALWLESDRMNKLDFSQQSLDVQKNVVVEEFKQRYLNQPYGDIWLKLRPTAYKVHPYQWATIGISPKHIEDAQLEDVKEFFYKYYRPNNAILSLSGNFDSSHAMQLINKWFGDIEPSPLEKSIPQEPAQLEQRNLEVSAEVPMDALYMCWHMPSRTDPDYYAIDLLSDVLSRGKSARLYQKYIKEQAVFNQINAYVTGEQDPGLFVIGGILNPGQNIDDVVKMMWSEIELLKNEPATEKELIRILNQLESEQTFGFSSGLSIAMQLCFAEMMGNTELINTDINNYQKVTVNEMKKQAEHILSREKATILKYKMISS